MMSVDTASRKADDYAHRPRRIGLRPRYVRQRRQRGSARGQMQELLRRGSFIATSHFHTRYSNHLVGAGDERRRHVQANRLRHDQVNDEVELSRPLDRKIGGLRPSKILSTKSPARR